MKKIIPLMFALCLITSFLHAITIGGTIHIKGRKHHCFKSGEGCDFELTLGVEIPIGKLILDNAPGHLYLPDLNKDEIAELDFSDRDGQTYVLTAAGGKQYRLTFGKDKGHYDAATKSVELRFRSVAVMDGALAPDAGITAKNCPNPAWNKDAFIRRWLLSLNVGFMSETGGNVPVSSGQTASLYASLPLLHRFFPEREKTPPEAAAIRYPTSHFTTRDLLSLALTAGGRYASSTISAGIEKPFIIDGQTGTPTITTTGGSVHKTMMWELGAQLNWQLKNFTISPIITGGIISQSVGGREVTQTTSYNGTTRSYRLSADEDIPATQGILRGKLRAGYSFGNNWILFAEGSITKGASYTYRHTSYQPKGEADTKGMYNIDQMLSGVEHTETKTGSYSANEVSIGVCFGIGRKRNRIPDDRSPGPYNPYGTNGTQRGVQPDDRSDSSPRLPGGKTSAITIAQSEEFVWNEPAVLQKLGLKSITFAPGEYSVATSREYPYGSVTLDVKGYEPVSKAGTLNTARVPTNCVPRSGRLCRQTGFDCLVMFPGDGPQMSVEPVLDEGHILRKLTLIMGTVACLNVWEDPRDPNNTGCANPRNPFDEAGRQHNAYLESLMTSEAYSGYTRSVKSVKDPLRDFIEGWLIPKGIKNFNAGLISSIGNGTSPLALLDQFDVSPAVRKYAAQAYELVKRLPTDRLPEAKDFVKLRDFEKSILDDKQLPRIDKEQILRISSAGRYSCYYWRVYRGVDGQFYLGRRTTTPKTTSSEARTIDWDRLAGVDMMTCIGGPECGAACSIVDFMFQAAGK